MHNIILEHVTYRFREHLPPALDDVSLSLHSGERVCIIGANGSGKTTLVRYIAGLLPNLPKREADSNIAFLFQNPDNQMVAVTVDKELAFGLENIAMPTADIERRISDEAAQFDITKLLSRLTTELSGGEKQRVALASVLIAGASVLVLDEPDAFLDQPGRDMLSDELGRIRVQHPDLIEIRIAQSTFTARQYPRVILMDNGRIVADGAPDVVITSWAALQDSSFRFSHAEPATDPGVRSIQARDLAAALGGQTIFSNLNLTLSAGKILCVVGATGSGKSTLGHVLAGLLKPAAGSITFLSPDGTAIENSHRSRVITAVLQQPERQFFLPTCAEEIAFGPRNLGVPFDDASINLMLQSVGNQSENYARRDPLTLSSGEKRRLAFAVSLALGTPFIIYDEPTAGLDMLGTINFIAQVDVFRALGRGQVIITHEAGVAKALADEVLVLQSGRGQLFSASDFFAHYPWQRLLSQDLILV